MSLNSYYTTKLPDAMYVYDTPGYKYPATYSGQKEKPC